MVHASMAVVLDGVDWAHSCDIIIIIIYTFTSARWSMTICVAVG